MVIPFFHEHIVHHAHCVRHQNIVLDKPQLRTAKHKRSAVGLSGRGLYFFAGMDVVLLFNPQRSRMTGKIS